MFAAISNNDFSNHLDFDFKKTQKNINLLFSLCELCRALKVESNHKVWGNWKGLPEGSDDLFYLQSSLDLAWSLEEGGGESGGASSSILPAQNKIYWGKGPEERK